LSQNEFSPFVSIKFDAVWRVHRFLLPEVGFKPPLQTGDNVVVARGERRVCGTVTRSVPQLASRMVPSEHSVNRVVRRASKQDVAARLKQQHREREGYRIGLMKIRERALAMKLMRVEQEFDSSRLIFYFTADERVDFRDLVRELATEFNCRIEMRQVGARDEAKLLGGYGTCGRPLCCTTWLKEFVPISIKMAKQQHFSRNPSRLSGLCGRLKCCLRYELPNAAGEQFAGCANEGSCSRSSAGGGCEGGCGTGGCGAGTCSSCG
jgi:cell fate regulator YaaT (PSP1 superfamily)